MTLQARVIGPESDLGHVDTLNFFGNQIGREFSDVKLSPEQILKAEGNPYIELKGQAPTIAEQREASDDEVEEGLIRERLAELKVKVDGRASLTSLRSKLETAEKAEAKLLEDEAEAAAKAAEDAE